MNTTGFPSPAQDYEKQTFDFNELLIRHPSSTFSMRYEGEDLQEFNIQKGDILIVDCSFRPKKDFFGIVIFDNTFHCVYIQKERNFFNFIFLLQEQKNYYHKYIWHCSFSGTTL